jgi:hypothetical protein
VMVRAEAHGGFEMSAIRCRGFTGQSWKSISSRKRPPTGAALSDAISWLDAQCGARLAHRGRSRANSGIGSGVFSDDFAGSGCILRWLMIIADRRHDDLASSALQVAAEPGRIVCAYENPDLRGRTGRARWPLFSLWSGRAGRSRRPGGSRYTLFASVSFVSLLSWRALAAAGKKYREREY